MVIFATGRGAVTQSGPYGGTSAPVVVSLQRARKSGNERFASFGGRASGFIGRCPGERDDAGYVPGPGIPLTLKAGSPQQQCGVGRVTAMKKIETNWCERVDYEGYNVIKSSEHRFASELRCLPRRFVLKEKDFS